jgi:hypothetical protein
MVRQERFCTWEMVMNEDMKAVGRVGWGWVAGCA